MVPGSRAESRVHARRPRPEFLLLGPRAGPDPPRRLRGAGGRPRQPPLHPSLLAWLRHPRPQRAQVPDIYTKSYMLKLDFCFIYQGQDKTFPEKSVWGECYLWVQRTQGLSTCLKVLEHWVYLDIESFQLCQVGKDTNRHKTIKGAPILIPITHFVWLFETIYCVY